MSAYGQFCPIAKAMEVLDERWTLLVGGRVGVDAPSEVARAVPSWIGQSLLSGVPRPA